MGWAAGSGRPPSWGLRDEMTEREIKAEPGAGGIGNHRYRAVRVLGNCEHCGMPLPLMGPIREVPCAHCQETSKRSAHFWATLVDQADCWPDTTELEGHQVEIRMVGAVPSHAEQAASDAPDWLRAQVPAVRRLFGARQEGAAGQN